MKQKLMVKYSLVSTLLVVVVLGLLVLAFEKVNAGPPEPTQRLCSRRTR